MYGQHSPFDSPVFRAHQCRLAVEDLIMLLKSIASGKVRTNPTATLRVLEQCRDDLNAIRPESEEHSL